jgi:UDP-N-acetylmuramate dehydrogenase
VPFFVLGGGSNLVIADEGFDGLVVHVDVRGARTHGDGADALVPLVQENRGMHSSRTACTGPAGLECLSGIPGTVGGTPIQNVGAYGQEVAHRIERLTVLRSRANALCTLTERGAGFRIA